MLGAVQINFVKECCLPADHRSAHLVGEAYLVQQVFIQVPVFRGMHLNITGFVDQAETIARGQYRTHQ